MKSLLQKHFFYFMKHFYHTLLYYVFIVLGSWLIFLVIIIT